MVELLAPSEYQTIKPLFAKFHLNEPILYSILENRSMGKVFTDDAKNPSYALVYNPAGYAFLVGNIDSASLNEVRSYLQTLPKVCLACPLDWEHKSFFEEGGFVSMERIQLRSAYDPLQVDSWKSALPSQYHLDTICSTNFDNCTWHSFISSYYGGNDRFYEHGKGLCLIDQDKVVSESYGIIVGHMAEIGVVTDEKYQGKNLGTIVSAFMLEYCYKNGFTPIWSCYVSNKASWAIAKKLGFQEDCRYCFLNRTISI